MILRIDDRNIQLAVWKEVQSAISSLKSPIPHRGNLYGD